METYEIDLPKDSLIISSLDRIDYQDIFAIKIPSDQEISLEELPLLFFDAFPKWFNGLMQIREAIAGKIGLKTAKGIDIEKQIKEFKGLPGQSLALFHVLGRTENEILCGENDKHLDFRASFFSRPVDGFTEIAIATTVQFNAYLGKAYFLPVQPIHKMIVPIILKRMVKNI